MKKIFLYDPRYNLKTETNYKELSTKVEQSVTTLRVTKNKNHKVQGFWHIIDEKTTKKELYDMYSKVKYSDEAWKVVEGSDGKFQISNYGRVKRVNSENETEFILPYFRKRTSKTSKPKHGLQYVRIQFKGVLKEYSVARIVAYHFVDYYKDDKFVSDIDSVFDQLVVMHKNELEYDNYHGNLKLTHRSELTKRNNATVNSGHSIVVYDASTGEALDYFKSIEQAAKKLNIGYNTIRDNLKRKYKTNVVLNKYIFEYASSIEEEIIKEKKLINNIMNVNKPIGLIDPVSGEVIQKFYSIEHAKNELNSTRDYIKRFLDIPFTEEGLFRDKYLFKTLTESELEEVVFENMVDKIKPFKVIQKLNCIIAIDSDSNRIIGKYPSALEAAKHLPVSDWSIRDYIKRGELAKPVKGKYIFKKIEKNRYSKSLIATNPVDETFIGAFNTITEASENLGLSYDCLKKHLQKDYRKPFKGKYKFEEVFA